MEAVSMVRKYDYCEDRAELRDVKLLFVLMSALLIADWVLPQYFGVHIGFDFTGTRILNIIILFYLMYNRKAASHFLESITEVQITPYLALYMFVMVYTTVLRVNVNTFFLNFLDILTFYMVYYGIRYVIGIGRTIDWTVRFAGFIGIYGVIEYITGYSIMLKFLMTVPNAAISVERSGQYRIMGNCVHPIAYGMLLLMLIAVACIDYEQDEIYLFKHPVILVLLIANVFMTGSRSTLALAALELFLIVVLSSNLTFKKTMLLLVVFVLAAVAAEVLIYKTPVGQYVMRQITSVIDEIFGTTFSAYYGADVTLLNQSSAYRESLPKIFSVEWLNPIVGRGANASVGFEFDGVYIHSIDNYYIAMYIRYGYPGMIAFILIQLSTLFFMARSAVIYRSGLCKALFIAILLYSISLYWVDYLQTTKYMYIIIALYCAYYSVRKCKAG